MDPKMVTEEDLLKSIKELEAKTEAAPAPKAAEPEIAKVKLAKSTAEALREGASPSTKRALDVSDVLMDFVGLMGKHNDDALTTLQKSINAGAERDLAIVKVLGDLRKSIDANTAAIEKWGNVPPRPRSVPAAEVLHKSAGDNTLDDKVVKLDPRTAKRQITQGLELLAKSLDPSNPRDQQKISDITNAAIKFEATGQIEERHIAAAQKALAAPAA